MSYRKPITLKPSPLTSLRVANRLSMEEAALKLNLSTLQIARIEAATKTIPRRTRRSMASALTPPGRFVQLSIFDYLEEVGANV